MEGETSRSIAKRGRTLSLTDIFSPPPKRRVWDSPDSCPPETGEANTLFELVPLEIMVMILNQLPFDTWFASALVCRRWARAFSMNRNFFTNKKFIACAMHLRPSLWGRLMSHRPNSIRLPPKMMTPTFFKNVAKFVKCGVVFEAILDTESFRNASALVVQSMISGAIMEDNYVGLRLLVSSERGRKTFDENSFLLACQCYHKFPGKNKCLPLLMNKGIVDEYLVEWPIVQILTDNKLHTAINRLSKSRAFFSSPQCAWIYAAYAMKGGREDLLKRVLLNSTIDHTLSDHAILRKSCSLGWDKVVSYLITHGGDPTVGGQEPLKRACLSNRIKVVKRLLLHPDVNPGRNMNEVVIKTIQLNFDKLAALLISHPKVNPMIHDAPSNSLLCLASKHCCPKAMEMLFKKHPRLDPNQSNHYPVRQCISHQFVNGLRILVKHPKLALTYEEVTHIMSLCTYISDTSLSKAILKNKQFANAFDEETVSMTGGENVQPTVA